MGSGLFLPQVYVIDDRKTKNAFVLPGGKIFVFTGILPICANDSGLATVLGHEIGHQGEFFQLKRPNQDASAHLQLLAIRPSG